VCLHEVLHQFGISHVPTTTPAVMNEGHNGWGDPVVGSSLRSIMLMKDDGPSN